LSSTRKLDDLFCSIFPACTIIIVDSLSAKVFKVEQRDQSFFTFIFCLSSLQITEPQPALQCGNNRTEQESFPPVITKALEDEK
jgi:hypothetical protein